MHELGLDWPLPSESFDAVVSANAFHWIDPIIRVTKATQALRSGGNLMIIERRHLPRGDKELFIDLRRCYERWDPETQPGFQALHLPKPPESNDEINESGLFNRVATRQYEWEQVYSTTEYLDLLMTYSDVLALDSSAQLGP